MSRTLAVLFAFAILSAIAHSSVRDGDKPPGSDDGKGGDTGDKPFGGDTIVPNGDREKDSKDDSKEYNLQTKGGDNGTLNFKGESGKKQPGESGSARARNSQEFEFSTEKGDFSMALEYESKSETNGNDIRFSLIVKALSVFEYDEVNGEEGYQKGADTVTGSYDLTRLPKSGWKPLDAQSALITSASGDSYTVWHITAQTKDEVFTAVCTFTGTPVNVGTTKLTSDSMKMDVFIKYFSSLNVPTEYSTGPSDATAHPNASVAVSFALGANVKDYHKSDRNPTLGSDNPTINFNSSDVNGFFSWVQTASLNNGTKDTNVKAHFEDKSDDQVNERFDKGNRVQVVYYSFPGARPELVSWDPEFGSSASADSTFSSSSVLFPCMFTFIIAILYL